MKNDTFAEITQQALKELLVQAKLERNKPLYKQLKLRLKQISSDTSKEDSNGN